MSDVFLKGELRSLPDHFVDPDRFPLGALWLQDHFAEDTFAGDPSAGGLSAGGLSAGGLLPRIFPKIPG